MDEAGFGLVPVCGKTWAFRGETPTLTHAWSPYARISAISGITTDERLFFRLKEFDTLRGPDVARFLKLLLQHISGEIAVVWDGGGQHRSKAVREVLHESPRMQAYTLPAYCPELNPDEKVWGHAKNVELKGVTPSDVFDLHEELIRAFRTMKRDPKLLRSMLLASDLPWGSALT